MTDTSPEAVERFDINWRDYRKDIDANGDYVTYEAYAALSAQLTAASQRAYSLAYAIAGGEDAPGLLDTVSTDDLCKMTRDERAWSRDAEISAHATGKAEGLRAAADFCKYKSAEWDHPSKTHRLMEWSLSIGCHHVGHAYEAGILALITTETPAAKVTVQAVDALASYQQADMDGVMVLVSRQAIEECLPALRAIAGDKT
jgi:hypothetical protein